MIQNVPPALDTLQGLVEFLKKDRFAFSQVELRYEDGALYCPTCGDTRRMKMRVQLPIPGCPVGKDYIPLREYFSVHENPLILAYQCVQCDTTFIAIVYQGPDGPDIVILPSVRGGLSTPHTPDGVNYYLDQAHKANNVGARSAAIAMYRGALEHFLFDQGYKDGMLGKKLKDLEEDIKNGKAPKWAMELDTEFLEVIKNLGNGSIHPNDGNVKKQATLDSDIIIAVQETFVQLLFLAYELPHQKARRLDRLRKSASILKK